MSDLSLLQTLLGGASGSLVGFTLGLVGGGGSILAVPLLVYLVGVPSAHVAIGTSAVAVAVNAAASVVGRPGPGMCVGPALPSSPRLASPAPWLGRPSRNGWMGRRCWRPLPC